MSLTFQPLIKKGLTVTFVLLCSLSFAQTPDFKVQHIQDDVSRNGGSNTSFLPISSLSSAVELATSNRKTHAGAPTLNNTLNGDDLAGARQLTDLNTLTYYREPSSNTADMRFNTSIWEYIGAPGGANEMIVRGRYAIDLNGSNNSVTQTLTGVTNADKCIPFITGIMNNSSSQGADSGTAIAYLENASTMRIQKGSRSNNVKVYITLVEFTGSNWTVLHGDSGNVSSDSGSITLRNNANGTGSATNVTAWGHAVIFDQFRADNTSSGNNDAISDLWPLIEPGNNNQQVDWTFESDHDSNGTNRHFVHVLVNSGMNVTRFQDNNNSSGESTVNISSAGLSDVNQAFIVGTSITKGKGTAYARGWRNYYLKSTTQAAHWCHRSGNPMTHEIQIIDLSGLQTAYAGAEINVQGNGTDIPSGSTSISPLDDTDFGGVEITGAVAVSHTFAIQNLGNANVSLTDSSPYVTLSGSTDFTLSASPNATIPSGGSTTFTITFNPTSPGTQTAQVSIANNDSDENPYTFLVQGTGDYCNSYGNLSWNTSVTYVSFNSISNADNEIPKDKSYEDFTAISTNIYKGSTHDLSVRVNTDGNYTVYTNVWIDWNRDGDFDDYGEEYDMGYATNVVDGLTSNSPMSITPPAFANLGATRMRVATRYYTYPTSCGTGYDGEVEDYTINLIDYLVDFDGVDDDVDCADNHNVTSAFSFESWVFQENTVATGTILAKGNIDASDKTGYHFSLKNNYPNFVWYDGSNNEILNITSPYAIPNNQWHHLAVTYDGSTVGMFIDGIEVATAHPTNSPVVTSNNFLIGADMSNYVTTPLNINYFDGAIQEIRIWGVALSQTQIREMMNQHIEQDGPQVKGTETKQDISGGLSWNSLLGYYKLDSNTAFDSSDYGHNGIPNNMDSSQIVTAPIPYETDGDSAWDTATTWLYNTDVYIPNTVGVDGSTVIDWNIVHLANNISSGNRDITLSALISETGTLKINGSTNINTGTGSGHSLTIANYLELDGVIDLEGESQLIQPEGSIVDADSGGYLERDQQGTANSFNYNYWSSCVGNTTGNSETRGVGVSRSNESASLSNFLNDGTDPSVYQPIIFNASPYAADSNTPSTPKTISSYWLYKFYGPYDNYNAWAKINETSSLMPGEGYTMKGTSGATLVSNYQNYVFKGMPNNGDITLPLDKSTGDVERLIGNPYPSAIDATQFILDNLSVADGGNNPHGTVINGALYFWDHFGQTDTHSATGYIGGYAVRNLTGGAVAISNDSRIDANGASGVKVPGRYIPVGQGFFVSTYIEGYDNNNSLPISTVDGGDIVFNNGQRVFETESPSASVFFKSSNSKKGGLNSKTVISTSQTIRLMYDSPLGYHRQLVLGANENASDDFDLGYDAFMVDVNEEDMYWTIKDSKFIIQGVDAFDETKEYPLGLIVKKSGMVGIKLDSLENVVADKAIYIKDNSTGETFQINKSPFNVYLEKGTYNERFKLVFQPANNKSLSVDDSRFDSGFHIYYNREATNLYIKINAGIKVYGGSICNLLGQTITPINGFVSETAIPLHVNSGAYLVRLKTDKGSLNKKIIIK